MYQESREMEQQSLKDEHNFQLVLQLDDQILEGSSVLESKDLSPLMMGCLAYSKHLSSTLEEQ